MRISLSTSRTNGFRTWSDAHPAQPKPTTGSGGVCHGGTDQGLDRPAITPPERSHLPWLVPGPGRV